MGTRPNTHRQTHRSTRTQLKGLTGVAESRVTTLSLSRTCTHTHTHSLLRSEVGGEICSRCAVPLFGMDCFIVAKGGRNQSKHFLIRECCVISWWLLCVLKSVCLFPVVEKKKYFQNLFSQTYSPGQDITSIWHFSWICFQSSRIATEQLWFSPLS